MLARVPLIVAPGAALVLARGDWRARFSQPMRRLRTGTIYGWETWEDRWQNIVVNQGLDDLLSITLAAGTQDTSWFVGLADGTPTVAAADVLTSHAGWVEVTAYDEAARQAWTPGSVSGQSVSNTASPASFTISTNSTTVGGAFLCGVVSGTSGRLYAAGAFASGDVVLNDGATLDITATFTTAAA